MALTLAEAAKLSNDILLQGVIETIIKDSPILQRMPFIEIAGNGLTYNREATAPSAAFFDVGDAWTESTPTFTQITAQLKIMGGDADIDNYLLATRSNLQDLEAAVVQPKAKASQPPPPTQAPRRAFPPPRSAPTRPQGAPPPPPPTCPRGRHGTQGARSR